MKRYHKFILPRYTTPQSPKTIRDPEVSNLQTFFPRYVPILPLPTPFPPPHPLLSPHVRWRLQKCTITGLTQITKDTSQLPQALSVSRIQFPFCPSSWLHSPAPRVHPPPPPHNLCAVPLPRSPGTEQNAQKMGLQLPAVAPLDKGLHQNVGVGSTVVAMVSMSPHQQQRKREPKSLHYAPCQNPHRLWKNVSPAP